MTYKERATSYPRMATGVITLLNRYPDDRILVHTVSYDLADTITRSLPRALRSRVCTYRSSSSKPDAIASYLATPARILIAPSLDRGVDLPHDDCRVIVVAKIPFPSLGDKQVNARLHSPGGQLWYSVRTVRSLVQMTGRGMRSMDDRCDSYILDASFQTSIWNRHRHLLPQWWKDALIWADRKEPHANVR